jgi:uncharacterized protein (DUF488 family)
LKKAAIVQEKGRLIHPGLSRKCVDVRKLPLSRKPGFSKKLLAGICHRAMVADAVNRLNGMRVSHIQAPRL